MLTGAGAESAKTEVVMKELKMETIKTETTKIKLCGMMRTEDIEAANELLPDYVGFVLAKEFRRYVSPDQVADFRKRLDPGITAVGVFVDEEPERVAELLEHRVIDMAQLHGSEDEAYIRRLRSLTDRPLSKAFRVDGERAVLAAAQSSADYILLDSGTGTGKVFDWDLAEKVNRPFFLAGGLNPENVREAVERFHPFAVDVSSGIETDGKKDREKMIRFVRAVRGEE